MNFLGIYLSNYQRPIEIIPGLRSKPVWNISDLDKETVKMIQKLEENWQKIFAEATELEENKSKWLEVKDLVETGKWDQLQCLGREMEFFILSLLNFNAYAVYP